MSVEQQFRWRCDGCFQEDVSPQQMTPEKWICRQDGVTEQHFCPRCAAGQPTIKLFLRLILEVTGNTHDDLVAAMKQATKDLKDGLLASVGGKLGGAFSYRTAKIGTAHKEKESSQTTPTTPQNDVHASIPCVCNNDHLRHADQSVVNKTGVAQEFDPGAGDISPSGLADLAAGDSRSP